MASAVMNATVANTVNNVSESEKEKNNETCDKLRKIVQSAISKQAYSTAQFWADKAVSLSSGDRRDVLLLAQTYYLTSQYHRASFLMANHGLIELSPSCKCLAGKCHIACQEWDRALEILGEFQEIEEEWKDEENFEGAIENIASVIHHLRGIIYEAIDNRDVAISCYKRALAHDVYCYEAYEKLTSHHMLDIKGEVDVLEQLPFEAQCGDDADLIKFMYSSKIKKYDRKPKGMEMYQPPDEIVSNAEMRVSQAEEKYTACDFSGCYAITANVLDGDPFHHACLPIHLACQVELKDTNGLFYMAHKLVDNYPEQPIAWYAVGCYYFLIKNNENARKFFGRASQLDIHFGHAWLGFGHSFAAEGENDQAMAAYSTCARLMSGCHLPLLYIGMEYVATNNIGLAQQYFSKAYAINDRDPSVLHELGVIAFKTGKYLQAVEFFRNALGRLKQVSKESAASAHSWEMTLSNLGRCYLKLEKYDKAIEMYKRALALAPKTPSIFSALGFVYHCIDNLPQAIEWYHKALGLRSEDSFCSQMLKKALEEMAQDPPIFEDEDENEHEDDEDDQPEHNYGTPRGGNASFQIHLDDDDDVPITPNNIVRSSSTVV